ncbi:MAG: hypothetical protein NC201_04920 [Prevotella sp.]|nr:hypothetical protein [Bacteroides sp.]MCM1366572.1 hypothetical protein [Prevotella sp.]MCM1437241.1 hypothetical protein [Prevotella sp.]
MKRIQYIYYLLAALIFLLPSCKPTENNYKKAYEAAKAKREKDASDPDIIIPGGKLANDDSPKVESLDGVSYLIKYQPLKLIAGNAPLQQFNVAIASYKMTANATSHWERIKKQFPDAVLVQNPNEIYFVCIGGYSEKTSAVNALKDYMEKYPDAQYLGIDEMQPVIRAATNIH